MLEVARVAFPVGSTSTYEWRQLRTSSLAALTHKFVQFKAMGGTTVSLDLSYVADIAEISDPTARLAAQTDFESRLRAYTAKAARVGLTVEALAGSPNWVKPEYRYVNAIIAKFVTQFNKSVPTAQRLVGLQFDLEPWATEDWAHNARQLTGHLLDTVALIVATGYAEPIAAWVPITVNLPFWLDGTGSPGQILHDGLTLSPTQHVMRLLDQAPAPSNAVTIMAYRDTTGGADGSLALSANEFRLATYYGGRVKVRVAQEIADVDPPRSTYFQEGLPALRSAIGVLERAYRSDPAFAGIAIDDMLTLSGFLT